MPVETGTVTRMIDALAGPGRPGRAGARRAARAARAPTCPRTAGGCSPTSTTRPWPGWTSWRCAAYALSAHVNGLDPTAFPSLLAMENALVGAAARLLGGGPGPPPGRGRQRHQRRHRVADPRGEGGPRRPPGDRRAAPGRPGRPRTPRSPRPRTTCGSRSTWCRSTRRRCGPTRPRWPPRSARTRCWSRAPRRRTRTAWSTRSTEIAAVAAERGRALPRGRLLRRLGAAVPAPARRPVPAVRLLRARRHQSISVDLHKYAYAPKGVSVLLHRDAALRRAAVLRATPTGPATRWSTR